MILNTEDKIIKFCNEIFIRYKTFFICIAWLISIPFCIGGAINYGGTGIFFAIPFLVLSFSCTVVLVIEKKLKVFIPLESLLLISVLCLYVLRVSGLQNTYLFPANGKVFILTENYCLKKKSGHDYDLSYAINDSKDCNLSKGDDPQGIELKKGQEFTVVSTFVGAGGIGREGYGILFETKMGTAYFYEDNNPIIWKNNGQKVKGDDFRNRYVIFLSNFMNYPMIFYFVIGGAFTGIVKLFKFFF